ncbi:hypothetical protein D3C73_1449460 [compost metagenome]
MLTIHGKNVFQMVDILDLLRFHDFKDEIARVQREAVDRLKGMAQAIIRIIDGGWQKINESLITLRQM